MGDRALPIVFFNLSGEMIYVIQQRLEVQNISDDKAKKVFQDIIATMLSDQFIKELFEPQHMYSRSAMQSVFEKLVHSSIMRLNTNSMSKLYDLMLMVFKYQVTNCTDPEEIILVTLNHMDAIRNCAKPYPELKKKIQNVYSLLISNYRDLNHEDYGSLYNCINAFLQDLSIRVSVLMKLGLQLPSGEIISSRNIDKSTNSTDLTNKKNCNSPGPAFQHKMQILLPPNCFDIEEDRGTSLGTNIYVQSTSMQTNSHMLPSPPMEDVDGTENDNCQSLEEITFLGRLIGTGNTSNYIPDITMTSAEDEKDAFNVEYEEESGSFVSINAAQVGQTELGRISSEFSVAEVRKEKSDILELLDIAERDSV